MPNCGGECVGVALFAGILANSRANDKLSDWDLEADVDIESRPTIMA